MSDKKNPGHNSKKEFLSKPVEHIDITIEADNSWVNIFDGYDREHVEYVNISLLNVWIRIPIKTLEEILKKGSAFINEHNHSQQEQDLVSEVD